jgi:uncharacterized membrane protein YphA (DoxX/SURF4 family)
MAQPRPAEPLEPAPAPPGPQAAPGPTRAAFQLLRVAFAALALVAGIDKFFDVLSPWRAYLAPDIPDLLGVSPQSVMHAAGVMEILAGLLVVFRPRVGGWLLAAWLWAIVANLLILPGHYDVALRDLALSVGAVALARLAPRPRRAASKPTASGPAPWRSTPA